MIDRVTSINDDVLLGIKNVSINEHFSLPFRTSCSGCVIEAMAQAAGILLLRKVLHREKSLFS